jgi:hypothetical protein
MKWKKIKDFENYSINENGIVRNDITNHIKSAYVNGKNGYIYVDLWKNNVSKKMPIHRLIAETFIPNPEGKTTVDHINGNRLDNSVENLRWATYSEQNSRFDTIGVRSEKVIVTHENGNTMNFDRIKDVANYFDCNISNISQMLKKGTFGKRGKTRYYKFEYLKK